MDIRMPEHDGIEATRRILASPGSRSRIIILTTFDLDEYVYDALRAGATDRRTPTDARSRSPGLPSNACCAFTPAAPP